MAQLRKHHEVSERWACRALGIDRSVVRYRACRGDDAAIRQRLRSLAAERRRFGYRRLGLLLAREGDHLVARQVGGQRPVVARRAFSRGRRARRCWPRGVLSRLVLGDGLFQILQAKLQLIGGQLSGAAAELLARQALDQQAQLVVLGDQLALLMQQHAQHLLQHGGVFRQGVRIDLHLATTDDAAAPGPELVCGRHIYPASSGLRRGTGARHSHPPSRAASCVRTG